MVYFLLLIALAVQFKMCKLIESYATHLTHLSLPTCEVSINFKYFNLKKKYICVFVINK